MYKWLCYMINRTDIFIEKSRDIHGEKYDYSKVDLEHRDEKGRVCIICPKHGEFWQRPNSHTHGCGCPKCWEERKDKCLFSNTNEFIEKAKKVHGDKYDYSKVEYKRSNQDVCIICPIHGEFWQTPNKHLGGEGCKECGKITTANKRCLKTEDFIAKATKVHNMKYIYNKTDLNSRDEKGRIIITCPIHGDFWQTPHNHLCGKGCKECGIKERSNKKKLSQETIISRFIKKYGDKYDYSKVVYKKMHSDVIITCPKHGDFTCTPANHLGSKGCPKCKMSHAECNVEKALIDNNIEYRYDARRKTLPWLEELTLDFYLPQYKIAIECQGGQHFYSVDYFGGEDKLKYRIGLDEKKRKLCEDNGVKILYYSEEKIDFPYENTTNVDELISKIKLYDR